ncbi:MAG: hypothetical protein HY815_04960 [Candidatus Riflebacteria bacterium]|nr:hypothetical protein [Candidatus Riflebacteria bacterium]
MADEAITTKSAAERFIKARLRSEARIGPGVIDTLFARLSQLGGEAVGKADAMAKAGDRTTVLERDVAETFQTVAPVGTDRVTIRQQSSIFSILREGTSRRGSRSSCCSV